MRLRGARSVAVGVAAVITLGLAVELVHDPMHGRILSLRTTAVAPIPAARIHAGQTLYAQTWVHRRAEAHPPIPPVPFPDHPSMQTDRGT